MKAYKQGITKKQFVAETLKHQKADEFIRGEYWDGSNGCAVGCALKSISVLKKIKITNYADHALYETHLGIPEWLARVEDRLFEGMSEDLSKKWPVEFAKAIHPGADLDQIKGPFLIMVLKSALKSFDQEKYPKVKESLDRSIALWKRKDQGSDQWKKDVAAAAAYASAAAAAYASAAAASAAASADAAAYASAAAAAYAAASAAASAASAASAAAASAAYASAAAAAAAAARRARFDYFSRELLKLMRKCRGRSGCQRWQRG